MHKSLFFLQYNQAMWCFCHSWEFGEKVGISNAHIAKQTNTVPQRMKLTKCLWLANGYALKPSQEFALTDVSWWTFAQKSPKCLILHPVSVGTLLSCTFCVSIKLGWKQSLLFTEQIFSMWNGEQLQLLPCQQFPSIQLKMLTHCILNYSHPEWSLTLAFMTGEKSLITLGWRWKVLLFVAFLWILRKLTMFYEFLAQCHVPIQRKNFPWLTKKLLWIPKRYDESTFWWIKYK